TYPQWDEALTVGSQVELPVQVNGKTRAKVMVNRGATQEQALAIALADATVQKFVAGKDIRKVIYVPDRLLNIVVG
ncbi:MAG TPA: hypothetical protein VG692_12140, partial [Gemmatimonadales bacterium]|nr:hypothetical protein [Gemmatimonadales bacterium]